MGLFSDVGNFFKKAGNTISGGFKQVTPIIRDSISTVYNDVKSIVSFGGKQVNKIYDVPKQLLDKGSETVQHLGDNVQGIAGSLAMPLMIAGGAVLLIMVVAKK